MNDIFKINKARLIKYLSIILVFLIGLYYVNTFKKKLWMQIRVVRDNIRHVQNSVTENNLLLNGYELDDYANYEKPLKDTLFFVGHIYPQNGYNKKFNGFLAGSNPVKHLLSMAEINPPLKIVFGGDSIYSPTSEALDFLNNLKTKFKVSQFILGNHENYWEYYNKSKFKEVFPERYFYEDVNGVRFVYLHSMEKAQVIGLDDEQKKFLGKALEPSSSYSYSLVFLHHALWGEVLANVAYANSNDLRLEWETEILPLLNWGRVRAVFAGDGGVVSSGLVQYKNGIPHFLSGWTIEKDYIPPEWLRIDLGNNDVQVSWQKLVNRHLYTKKQETQSNLR